MTSDELRKVIVLARRVRNFTQADIAKRAGIKRSTYALFEAGHIELKPEQVHAVEAVLDAATARSKKLSRTPKLRARVRRVERQDAALSQMALAKLANVPQTTVSLWERNRPELRPDDLARIDQALTRRLQELQQLGIGRAMKLSDLPQVKSVPLSALASMPQTYAPESPEEAIGRKIARQEGQIEALREQVTALRKQVAQLDEQNKTLLSEWVQLTQGKVN